MNKIIVFIFCFFICYGAISQPISYRASDVITVSDGRLQAQYNLFIPRYTDTTAANLKKGIDSCGALIYTYEGNKVWKRSCNPKRWEEFGSSGGTGTVTSISQAYGITNTPNPITTTGTIKVDTTTGGLSGKYLRIVDTTNKWVQSVTKVNDSTIRVTKNGVGTNIVLPIPSINNLIDSLKRSTDSVFAKKNGSWIFQYKDSIGGGSNNLQSVLNQGNLSYQKSILIVDSVNTGSNANVVAVLSSTDSIRGLVGPPFVGLEKRFTNNYATLEFNKTTYPGKLLPTIYLSSSDLGNEFRARSDKMFFKNLTSGNSIYLSPPNTITNDTLKLPNATGTLLAKINSTSPDSTGNINLYYVDSLKRNPGTDSIFARKNGVFVFQYKDSVGNGSGFVPYTGATQDVDLGTNKISAQSVYITGTNGNGHLHLKHQASDATATGQSTALFADADGDLKWKNDGNYYSTLKTSNQTANRIYTYQNKSYTLGDSADIAARVKYTDTASMLTPYLRKIDTASLSNRINLKLNISDTTVFDRKSSSAFTFKANNTSATANATDQAFKDTVESAYTGTINWTGTAPTGTTNHRFKYIQIGKLVVLQVLLNYGTAGASNTQVTLSLPSGCPSPIQWSGSAGANDILSSSWAYIGTSTSAATTGRAVLVSNSSNNGFNIIVTAASSSARTAGFTMQYFAQ